MVQFVNNTKGGRAVALRDRSYLFIEAGDTSPVISLAAVLHYPPDLERIDTGGDAVKPRDRADILSNMSDDELASFFERVTGKPPHHKMKRETIEARLLAEGK